MGPYSPASSIPDSLYIDTRGSDYDDWGMAVYPGTSNPARYT